MELNNFKFNKKLGQNFIFDNNLLCAIAKDSGINKDDEVLEIGAGAGTLTNVLKDVCKKVVSYEIDNNLKDILAQKFKDTKNVEIIFKDALKTDLKEIENNFDGQFHIVANLPYYITTPLIFKFIQSKKVASITIMVQKEVANRMVANVSTSDYGILSVMLQFYGDVKICRIVKRQMFTPMPNVDSAVVNIVPKPNVCDAQIFSDIVHKSFAMRRKTILNNLSSGFDVDKVVISNWLTLCNIPVSSRAENLSIEDFVKLTKTFDTISSYLSIK